MKTDSLHLGKAALRLIMLILLLPALLAFLPGSASIPAIDRDEARFAQSSKQMLESGDFITPRFQEELRAKKPVGIYWMQAASAALLGADTMAAYRLPSIIGAVAVVMFGFGFALRSLPPPYAFIAAGFMASSITLAAEAHFAKTDAMLCAMILIQQIALWRILRHAKTAKDPGKRPAIIFWCAMAAAILIKGPIAPVIAAGTIGIFAIVNRKSRIFRRDILHLKTGAIAMGVIILPWVLLVSYFTQGEFIINAVRGDLVAKVQSGQESHGAPPLTHLILLVITFWPGSLLLMRGMFAAWEHRKHDMVIFLLGWVIPFWLLIELTPTKLPHYFLPVMPALAILLALGIDYAPPYRPRETSAQAQGRLRHLINIWTAVRTTGRRRACIFIWDAFFIMATIGLGTAVLYAASVFGGDRIAGVIALLLTFAMAGLALFWIMQRHNVVLLGMIITAGIFHAVVFGAVMPSLSDIHIAPRIKSAIEKIDGEVGSIAAAGYHEPSVVFTLGTDTLLFAPADVAFFLGEAPDGVGIVESRAEPEFLATAARAGITLRREATISGYNISRGQRVEIGIFRRSE